MLDLAIEVGKKLFKCSDVIGITVSSMHLKGGTGLLAKAFKIFIGSICPMMVQKLW